MQLFLPFACIYSSLRALDNKRLGKQRVEAMQVYLAVTNKAKKSKWAHQPAALMWAGYELLLRKYILASVEVWGERRTKDGSRFFDNTKMKENIETYGIALSKEEEKAITYPPWWGQAEFHDSHKAMLFHKGEQARKIGEMLRQKALKLKARVLQRRTDIKEESADELPSNFYECFRDCAHITQYHWPVAPKSGKRGITSSSPSTPHSAKRRREIEALRKYEEAEVVKVKKESKRTRQ